MQLRFSVLSRFGIKFVEVAGAGFASAVCAYCLGHIGEPPGAAAPIVQVLPAGDDAIRMVRDDHALLAALARKEAENHAKPESAPAAPSIGPVAKPARPPQPAQVRRNRTPEQAVLAEVRPRLAAPLPIQAPISAPNFTANPAGQRGAEARVGHEGPAATSASNGGEDERPLLARLQQIPSWFLPDNDRIFGDVPRPPMPVGGLLQSAM